MFTYLRKFRFTRVRTGEFMRATRTHAYHVTRVDINKWECVKFDKSTGVRTRVVVSRALVRDLVENEFKK